MKFDTGDLRPLAILKQLSESTLAWLSDHGTRIELDTADQMFTQGQPANFMFIIVSGKVQRYEKIGGSTAILKPSKLGLFTRSTWY